MNDIRKSEQHRAALLKFIASSASSLAVSYSWKVPPFEDCPLTGTPMERSVQLRRVLSNEWAAADLVRRRELTRWYIATFGGVRGNKPETIVQYASNSDSELISLGRKGVASWSKVLAMRSPDKYAIFDARVSFSLNAVMKRAGCDATFPNLPTQNRLIRAAQPQLRPVHCQLEFYPLYLQLAGDIGSQVARPTGFVGSPIELVEMVLFSAAEQLAADIMKG